MMTTLESVATTVVVASARPAALAQCSGPRTTAAAAPVQGSGLPVFSEVPTFGPMTAHSSTKNRPTYTRKAVITQDPYPVSGKQLRSHPPV